jgi:hypothetical protein
MNQTSRGVGFGAWGQGQELLIGLAKVPTRVDPVHWLWQILCLWHWHVVTPKQRQRVVYGILM